MTPYKPPFLLSVDVSSASSETLNYGLFNMFCSVVKSKMYELTEAKKKKNKLHRETILYGIVMQAILFTSVTSVIVIIKNIGSSASHIIITLAEL